MATSPFDDLKAVWLVWSRRLISELRYWLFLIGYERDRRSFSSRIYLVYVIIFFSIWIFLVLTLFAGFAGQVLNRLPFPTPESAAVVVGTVAFVLYALLELHLASRRSPFTFSEEDSHLLCMTPVDRRFVAVIWLVDGWLKRGLLLWPMAVVLGYALIEARSPGELTPSHLPEYILAGLRMLLIAMPLLLGGQSLAWSAGAKRLGGKHERPGLRWLAVALAVLIFGGWYLATSQGGGSPPFWLWPAFFPFQAGSGGAPFPAGYLGSLAWCILGISLLWFTSWEMSLGRASQETRGQEAFRKAILTGSTDLAQELIQRERLGSGREPRRLPAPGGPGVLIWKSAIQGIQSARLGAIIPWLGIFGLVLGAFSIPDVGTRGWLILLWIYLAGQRMAAPLRNDLQRWWLLRQMPYASEKVVAASMVVPFLGVGLAGIAAMITAAILGIQLSPLGAWLYLPGAVGVSFSAAVDILTKCKTSHLLDGKAPDLSALTVLLGALAVGLPGGFGWLLWRRLSFPLFLSVALLVGFSAALDYGLYVLTGRLLRRIR